MNDARHRPDLSAKADPDAFRSVVLRGAGLVLAWLLLVLAWHRAGAVGPSVAPLAVHMAVDTAVDAAPMTLDEPPSGLRWQALDQRALASWRGPYWLRWQFAAAELPQRGIPGLRLSLRAAHRVWWNGELLGENGQVARTNAELPGRVDQVYPLPPTIGPRAELLVLASSQKARVQLHSADVRVEITDLQWLLTAPLRPWLVVALALGLLLLAWLSLGLTLRGRAATQSRLLLALGGVGLLLPLVEAWRPLLGYVYPWHGVRLHLLLLLQGAAALLLPAYLAGRFGVRLPGALRWGVLVVLPLLVLLPGFDARGALLLFGSLLASFLVLALARGEAAERVPILMLLCAGLLVLLADPAAFLDGQHVLLLAVLMAFLLLREARRQVALDRENERLRAEQHRLALQLLRRAIQPHWLMNMLTSLQELIEQAPSRASLLVERLAEQFAQLRESSQHARISLADEIALCRSYLDTVSLVVDQPIRIDVDAADLQLQLPPGVLHAQVENALTHAGAAACARRPFRLTLRRVGASCVLELRAARGRSAHRGQGTGTQYIEASLAVASPSGWRYTQQADGEDWVGRIELTCAS